MKSLSNRTRVSVVVYFELFNFCFYFQTLIHSSRSNSVRRPMRCDRLTRTVLAVNEVITVSRAWRRLIAANYGSTINAALACITLSSEIQLDNTQYQPQIERRNEAVRSNGKSSVCGRSRVLIGGALQNISAYFFNEFIHRRCRNFPKSVFSVLGVGLKHVAASFIKIGGAALRVPRAACRGLHLASLRQSTNTSIVSPHDHRAFRVLSFSAALR